VVPQMWLCQVWVSVTVVSSFICVSECAVCVSCIPVLRPVLDSILPCVPSVPRLIWPNIRPILRLTSNPFSPLLWARFYHRRRCGGLPKPLQKIDRPPQGMAQVAPAQGSRAFLCIRPPLGCATTRGVPVVVSPCGGW
jgi:hypothetical protein